ncbi:hypothetical protein [Pedobacter aquatilis]|uniref:hypothetical protein n=1 Tax=Pedobacter aquatilis TaxID=351343 RepID=UPI00292E4455|nr:hypothetical protein [Pedobacter aquatilis]
MKKQKEEGVAQTSGKGWLRVIKKCISVAGSTAGILLAAPLKLPIKVLKAAQYIVVAAGIIKAAEKDE